MNLAEAHDDPGVAVPDEHGGRVGALRRFARAAWRLAAAMCIFAVVVNWLSLRGGIRAVPGGTTAAGSEAAAVRLEDLPKAPVDMLPDTVLSYETIARQPVPGTGGLEAEAIYVTLNMDIEIQVPIAVYARVEAFRTEDEAKAALAEKMAVFTTAAANVDLGHGVVARTGEDSGRTAWAASWTQGQYLLFVKSAFRDKAPAEKRQFLKNLGMPVASAVARFANTGQQGVQR